MKTPYSQSNCDAIEPSKVGDSLVFKITLMNYSSRADVYANFRSVCPPDHHGLITVRRRGGKDTQIHAYRKTKPKANHNL